MCHLKRNAISKQFKSLAEFIVVMRIISGHYVLVEDIPDGGDDECCAHTPESFDAEGLDKTLFPNDVSEKIESQTFCEVRSLFRQELPFGGERLEDMGCLTHASISARDDEFVPMHAAGVKGRSEKSKGGPILSTVILSSQSRKFGMSGGDLCPPDDTAALKEGEICNESDLLDADFQGYAIPSIYVTEEDSRGQENGMARVLHEVSAENETETGEMFSFVHGVVEFDSCVNECSQKANSVIESIKQGDGFLSVPSSKPHGHVDFEDFKGSSSKGLGYLPSSCSDDELSNCTKSKQDTFEIVPAVSIGNGGLKHRKVKLLPDGDGDGEMEVESNTMSYEEEEVSMLEDSLVRDESSSGAISFRQVHEVTAADYNILLMSLVELVLWLCVAIYIIYSEYHRENWKGNAQN